MLRFELSAHPPPHRHRPHWLTVHQFEGTVDHAGRLVRACWVYFDPATFRKGHCWPSGSVSSSRSSVSSEPRSGPPTRAVARAAAGWSRRQARWTRQLTNREKCASTRSGWFQLGPPRSGAQTCVVWEHTPTTEPTTRVSMVVKGRGYAVRSFLRALVAGVSGMAPLMRVPCPGAVSTRKVPPSAASRSRMLRSPVPVGTDPGSNPAPSSTTSNATSRRLVAIVTCAPVAVGACLNVFCRASRQQK